MKCPRCAHDLTPGEIRRLNAQLNRSLASPPSKLTAKARAKKAADARWEKHRETIAREASRNARPNVRKGKARARSGRKQNAPVSDRDGRAL